MTGNFSCETVIVGGGIAGLTCAWQLAQRGREVALFESSSAWGGTIRTVRTDGFILEAGPNTVTSGPEMEQLVADLELQDEVVYRVLADLDRFIYYRDRMYKVPVGPVAFLLSGLFSIRGKVRILQGLRTPLREPASQDTVAGYFGELMGSEFVERALRPGLSGVFASDAGLLGMRAALPRMCDAITPGQTILAAVKRMRGSASGPRRILSFKNGLETLPARLAARLQERGTTARCEAPVTDIAATGNGYSLTLGSGETWDAKQVVIATGMRAAGALLCNVVPQASALLAESDTAPMRIVHVAVPEAAIPSALRGFGFLCADPARAGLLGALWPSDIFPHTATEGQRVMAQFFGGHFGSHEGGYSAGPVDESVQEDLLRRVMGAVDGGWRKLLETEWTHALPVLTPDHGERVNKLCNMLPTGMHLLGNYKGGPAILDRVREAELLADRLAGGK